jgi:hypothetical protein
VGCWWWGFLKDMLGVWCDKHCCKIIWTEKITLGTWKLCFLSAVSEWKAVITFNLKQCYLLNKGYNCVWMKYNMCTKGQEIVFCEFMADFWNIKEIPMVLCHFYLANSAVREKNTAVLWLA